MAQMPELDAWVARLLEGFEIPDAPVDRDAVLGLAGVVAHGIVRPAAPLTTYIAGYAAGLAAGSGMATPEQCVASADRLVRSLLDEHTAAGGPSAADAAPAPEAVPAADTGPVAGSAPVPPLPPADAVGPSDGCPGS
jgi:hypothetical protein